MSHKHLRVVTSDISLDPQWDALGGLTHQVGNSEKYKTGNWVPKSLEFRAENCINCGLCWAVCPDDSIILDEKGNMVGVDLDHCKDCGLCVEICPANKNPDAAKHALVFQDNEEKIL